MTSEKIIKNKQGSLYLSVISRVALALIERSIATKRDRGLLSAAL
jgi:hypothetical protein